MGFNSAFKGLNTTKLRSRKKCNTIKRVLKDEFDIQRTMHHDIFL